MVGDERLRIPHPDLHPAEAGRHQQVAGADTPPIALRRVGPQRPELLAHHRRDVGVHPRYEVEGGDALRHQEANGTLAHRGHNDVVGVDVVLVAIRRRVGVDDLRVEDLDPLAHQLHDRPRVGQLPIREVQKVQVL